MERFAKNNEQLKVANYLTALQLYWNHISHECCPVNLLHIFRIPFLKNTSGRLLLNIEVPKTLTILSFVIQYVYKVLWIIKDKIYCKVKRQSPRGILWKTSLRNFTKFTGNTCARVSFLIKFQDCNFIKKDTLARVFSYEFCEISKNTFSYKTPLVPASVGFYSSDLAC